MLYRLREEHRGRRLGGVALGHHRVEMGEHLVEAAVALGEIFFEAPVHDPA